jgi:hypothetical protein
MALTNAASGADHLVSLDDERLSCKGDRHNFPKLRVGTLPAGMTARTVRSGVYQLTYICPDCGTVRQKTTQRGGLVGNAKYTYQHPPGYLAPKGAGLTKSDYTAELARRAAPYIREAGRREQVTA